MLSMLGSKWRQYTTGMGKHSPMRHLAPRTSTHVLREPPTGHLPPSTHGATYGYKESRPDGMTIHHRAYVSRHAQSTFFRMATGHGFVGAFHTHPARRHAVREIMEEMVTCECGELPQTVEHILLECPKHLMMHGRPQTLAWLF